MRAHYQSCRAGRSLRSPARRPPAPRSIANTLNEIRTARQHMGISHLDLRSQHSPIARRQSTPVAASKALDGERGIVYCRRQQAGIDPAGHKIVEYQGATLMKTIISAAMPSVAGRRRRLGADARRPQERRQEHRQRPHLRHGLSPAALQPAQADQQAAPSSGWCRSGISASTTIGASRRSRSSTTA